MTTATLEIYHALIEAGVSEEKAEAAAKAVISRQEAMAVLATKEDTSSIKEDISLLRSEMYKALLIQAGVIVGLQTLVTTLI